MKALSLRQPWANAVLYLHKRIENRRWSTSFREQFGFVLENIRPTTFVPMRGALGFFDVPEDLMRRALG